MLRTSRSTGRNEKNLFRHGSQRNAGILNIRPNREVMPGTRSPEIRCNSTLPHILQCA
jgi:hypothetical protein